MPDWQKYWTRFGSKLRESGGPFSEFNQRSNRHYLHCQPFTNSDFSCDPILTGREKNLTVWIYIKGACAQEFFSRLELQKDKIEQELHYPLEWEARPGFNHCRIAYYGSAVDPEDEADWDNQHEWFVKHLNDLYRVFADRIKALNSTPLRLNTKPHSVNEETSGGPKDKISPLPLSSSYNPKTVPDGGTSISKPVNQSISLSISPELIERRLRMFWGYGSFEAPVWFVGMEEGLGGTDKSELGNRFIASDGKQTIDIRRDMLDVPLHMAFFTPPRPRLQPTLMYPIALSLYLKHKKKPTQDEIRSHQAHEFGDIDKCISSSFDLMPLPSRSTNEDTWLYSRSGVDSLSSRKKYLETHLPRRVAELGQLVQKHNPKLVIFYSIKYKSYWISAMKSQPQEIMNQMFFGKIQNTSFCIIPQGSMPGMSKDRLYAFAEKIAPRVSLG